MKRPLETASVEGGVILLLLITLVLLLAGCVGALPVHQGGRLVEGRQIPLVEGETQVGQYQTNDITVDYRYQKVGDRLQISGEVQFASGLQFNFTQVQYFHLGLILADAQGSVLQTQGLTSTSFVRPEDTVSFGATLRVDPQTTFMAFNYNGRATEGGMGGIGRRGGRDTETTFWDYPVAR